MKINCGLTLEEEIAAKEKWHAWFAWHPVRVKNGGCRWLETVKRRGKYKWNYIDGVHFIYEYKPMLDAAPTQQETTDD